MILVENSVGIGYIVVLSYRQCVECSFQFSMLSLELLPLQRESRMYVEHLIYWQGQRVCDALLYLFWGSTMLTTI
jgi:hypothetical protein